MLWASFDADIPDDPDFVALEQENPAWPWWWMRLLQFAKRANKQGLILKADGRPVTALHLAQTHHRDKGKQGAWQEFLDFTLDLELLVEEEGVLRIRHWRRWHKSPSDLAEETRERKRRQRGVTPSCHECHESHETQHSTAEQSTEQHSTEQQQQSTAQHASHEFLATQNGGGGFCDQPESVSSMPELVAYAQALRASFDGSRLDCNAFQQEAQRALAHDEETSPQDYAVALLYGVACTKVEMRSKTVKKPWVYADTIAKAHLKGVSQYHALARGDPGIPLYRFKPPLLQPEKEPAQC